MQQIFRAGLSTLSAYQYCSLALAIMSPSAYAAGFQTGDFDAQDWQQTTLVQNGSSAILSIQNSGGNPDQYWVADYTLPASSAPVDTRLRIANINTVFSYDPATQGALKNIDFSFDLRGFDSSFGVAGYYRPAISQGGLVYSVEGSFKQVDVSDWSTEHWHFDNTTQWVTLDGQTSPGLDAQGGILQFGYIYGIATTCGGEFGCLPATTSSGLDNYAVRLTTAVPEPETYAMLLGGLGLLVAFGRKQRQSNTTNQGNNHA